jgi:hypothetical protein
VIGNTPTALDRFAVASRPMGFLRRVVRTVRLLARDGGLPRWLRGLAALGLAPVPGPFDELVLLVVAAILWLGYRDRLRAAWEKSAY